jgi:hypothetical protein
MWGNGTHPWEWNVSFTCLKIKNFIIHFSLQSITQKKVKTAWGGQGRKSRKREGINTGMKGAEDKYWGALSVDRMGGRRHASWRQVRGLNCLKKQRVEQVDGCRCTSSVYFHNYVQNVVKIKRDETTQNFVNWNKYYYKWYTHNNSSSWWLIILNLVKKFPAFHKIRSFIILILTLSSHSFKIHFNIIIS